MELDQVRHVLAVVKYRTFLEASFQLNRSQSSLSKSIRRLEEELGKPVLTSNQCGLWGALRGLGLSDTVDSLGTLFGM